MPSGRPWLEDWTSGRKPLLPSASGHELPRWQSASSSMTASIIPRPVIQSIYAVANDAIAPPAQLVQTTPLHDRQHELEADLQFLLDAQADGLVRGLDGGAVDERSSTGSSTPTTQSVRALSARRKPMRRQPGLRSARKGIYNSILALSALKDEELEDFDHQSKDHADTLQQIDQWEAKRVKLNEAAKHLDSGEETVRIQRLRQESDTLEVEIQDMETQLMTMKTRQRKLQSQIAVVENSVDAKLSLHTSSLQLLEEDVRSFLGKEPADSVSSNASQDSTASMWRLPPQRRTLDMAKQFYQAQNGIISRRQQEVARERTALHSGAALWKDVIHEVSEFEKQLRTEMAMMSHSSSYSAWEEPPTANSSGRSVEILSQMTNLTASLESKSNRAKEQHWNLLVAAIGAELDAARKGKEIMEGVLGVSGQKDLVDASVQDGTRHASGSNEEIRELDRSFRLTRVGSSGGAVSDDDPDPELLFSKQDIE